MRNRVMRIEGTTQQLYAVRFSDPNTYPPRMSSCSRIFHHWLNILRDDADPWVIRDIQKGMFWRNSKTVAMFSDEVPDILPWSNAVRGIHHEDVHRVEDAHSRILKTGAPATVEFRLKTSPTKPQWIRAAFQAMRCTACPKHCAVIAGCAVPIREPYRPRSLSGAALLFFLLPQQLAGVL